MPSGRPPDNKHNKQQVEERGALLITLIIDY